MDDIHEVTRKTISKYTNASGKPITMNERDKEKDRLKGLVEQKRRHIQSMNNDIAFMESLIDIL